MKDYRCKDCEWWKEYGGICTWDIENFRFGYRLKHTAPTNKKCKHFKLRK